MATSNDLRHMTSNSNVHAASMGRDRDQHKSPQNRHSQLIHTSPSRIGSKSPTSIPSSPTSVYSSSSAIFERDVEPAPCPSPPHPHHPTNPHRIPRAKTTETIEHTVPSVLDSAAEILASLDGSVDSTGDAVSVIAPATRTSGFASPIGSFRSRSPSPFGSPGRRASLHLSPPSIIAGVSAGSPVSPMALPQQQLPGSSRLTVQTQPVPIPQAPAANMDSPSDASPKHATLHALPNPHPHQQAPASVAGSPRSLSTSPLSSSHPPSPAPGASKRLSFMSYADLLSSTPTSTVPLSLLTTAASAVEPPPHIRGVGGYAQQVQGLPPSATASLKDFLLGVTGGSAGNVREGGSGGMLDDIGGEWEREGLGSGLEARLEALMPLHA